MDYNTIKENLRNSVYQNKVPSPKMQMPRKPNISEDSRFYQAVMQEYKESLIKYNHSQNEYVAGHHKALVKFKTDIIQFLIESGANQIQAQKAWDLVWGRGASQGLYTVLDEAEYFAEIFAAKDENEFNHEVSVGCPPYSPE